MKTQKTGEKQFDFARVLRTIGVFANLFTVDITVKTQKLNSRPL